MIDIKLIRENFQYVKENIATRYLGLDAELSEIVDVDKKWRDVTVTLSELRHKRNVLTKEIAELKKQGLDITQKVEETRKILTQITEFERTLKTLEKERTKLLLQIPNLVHESVPIGKDSNDNVVLKHWGEKPEFDFEPKSHIDLMETLDIGDIERAARATGARFYYLKNQLFRLGLALATFTVDYLTDKGFIPMETPFMLRRDAIQGAISLSDFEDVIYKIENEDLYLIATAEHTLLAYHMSEILDDLPKCYVGYSTNFRKEAGAHGKDTRGIFRVHQFDKVEQFVFCRPEDSWYWHENLIKNAEELYQHLKIPYRVVVLCSGDVGKVASKTYDLEAWMPVQKQYREVVSCSNCTDYQARRLNIRYRTPRGTMYVHTLNSTAIAIQRTLVAIMENYQQKDGSVKIPEVLIPYMQGLEQIGK
jgi:seryl-tRNA synthetase